MKLGSIFFWMSFIGLMALGVIGYEKYYKGLRTQSKSLQKATNSMGAIKQDMGKLRQQYDSNLGPSSSSSGGVGGASGSAGMRANADKRIKELQKRRLQQK